MKIMDTLTSRAPAFFNGLDAAKTSDDLFSGFKKKSGYFALNRLIGMAIPFAKRAGFSVQEVRSGYLKASIPLKGNKNHIHTMYAGALFTLAEIPGGVMSIFEFGNDYFPLLKELKMTYLKLAKSDVTVEFTLSAERISEILEEVEAQGKSEFVLEGILTDMQGEEVARSEGLYKVRKR